MTSNPKPGASLWQTIDSAERVQDNEILALCGRLYERVVVTWEDDQQAWRDEEWCVKEPTHWVAIPARPPELTGSWGIS